MEIEPKTKQHLRDELARVRQRITEIENSVGRFVRLDLSLWKREDAYYRRFLAEFPDGFSLSEVLYDKKGNPHTSRFIEVNPAFERLTGLDRDQILDKTLKEVFPGLKSYWTHTYQKCFATGKAVHSVKYFKTLDKYFEITAYSPEKDRFVVIIHDSTEQRKAAEENKKLQLQLIHAQKMEDIGNLSGGIAHDFNNLITAIHGYAEVALMQIENKEYLKESLGQILLAAQRAANLTQQLLIFTRKEQKEVRPCNLTEIIKNHINMLKRIIGENISIRFELDPDLWTAEVDRGQIEQVMMNLAVNARDAMPEGGTLSIKTMNVQIDKACSHPRRYTRPGKFVSLVVEDTGIGMDAETREKIFKAFYTTKKSGKGTGLGLSVVDRIVKEHRGWIHVYSEVGMGSTFKIYLPSCSLDRESDTEKSVSMQTLQGTGETILFVEDDTVIYKFVKTQLTKNGYRVFAAKTVESALDIFEREKEIIEILITDVVLPDTSGVKLVNILLSRKPGLKVILTSGYLDKKAEWPSTSEKSYQFLQKPYSLTDLLRLVKEISYTIGE